ncbi:MAG: PspC domain-containing protein [Bacteroidales bacterium]|nr:PspC domain-containing protein [Bacteroidales bacterium]
MKEVEKVSIGGYAFTLDTDASELAQKYLDELQRHYQNREGGNEILDGIEERMAELLNEKCGRDGVVTLKNMETVIAILGRPEDIDTDETGAEQSRLEEEPRRKLYRDISNQVIAGVCSGLGAYLNVDPALFRIIFTVLTIAMCFTHWFMLPVPIIYIILWICMPPAKTVRQRWEQRGVDATLGGIERSVESGGREFEDAVRRVGNSNFFQEFGKVCGKLVGLLILLIGFAGLFAGFVMIFGTGWFGTQPGPGLFGLSELYAQGMHELYHYAPAVAQALLQPWMRILLMLVVFLPFLGMLYGGLQLLFDFKSPRWKPGLIIFILWLLSIVAAGILAVTGFVTTEMLVI